MKHTGEAVVHSRLLQGLKENKKILQGLATVILGFAMANSSILSKISPFGISFCSAVNQDMAIVAVLGGLVGYIVNSASTSMKYLSAIIIVGAIKWFATSKKTRKYEIIFAPVISFISILITSFTVTAVYGFNTYDLILTFAEALIGAGTAYFFVRAKRIFYLGQNITNLQHIDLSCLMISSVIVLMSFSSLTIGEVSLGRIISVVGILLFAYIGKEGGGAIAGIVCGIAFLLSMGTDGYMFGLFVVGGLMAGVFASMGKFAVTISFALSSIAVRLAMLHSPQTFNPIFDITIAIVIFLCIPMKCINKIKSKILRTTDGVTGKGVKSLIISKIDDAHIALKDISQTTKEVSEKLTKLKSSDIGQIYKTACDNICNKCKKKRVCWQINYSGTMDSLNNMTSILRKKGFITLEDITYPIKEKCVNQEVLIKEINDCYSQFTSNIKSLRQVSKVRSIVTDQFDAMALMLEGFSQEISQITDFDEENTEKIGNYFASKNIEILQINCYTDENSRKSIQIFIHSYLLEAVKRLGIQAELSEVCERTFEAPQYFTKDNVTRITLNEQANYTVEFAVSQHNFKGEKVCGDSYAVFIDGRSRAHMVLSDGMGSGYNAAVDSSMTVSLIRKLINAGVSYDATIRAANSALLVKAAEETLSTIDITTIDLFTGETNFYKAGAAPTYVRKYDKIGYVESTSLPVGILNSVSFEKSKTKLHDGDMIVMVSDGAVGIDDKWIKNSVKRFNGENIKELCDDIMVTAKFKCAQTHQDDITVMVCKIKKAYN